MQLKELRALTKAAGRKIQVKTILHEGRDSRKYIKVIPSFPTFFFSETARVDYIDSLNELEKELFYLDIDKIEKSLNIK